MHLARQLRLRQDLVYRGVSRKISAILAVVHGMLTTNPKCKETSSFRGNPANVLVSRQDRVV